MALYDNLKIASYAAAAEVYDKSRDLFEGFLPLVETALCSSGDKAAVSFLGLQQQINEIHGVKIPKDTLRHLINILENQGKVEFDHKKVVRIVDSWRSDSASLVTANQTSTNVLFQKFRDYLSKNGCNVSISDIRSQVCEWIYLHSSDLAKFVASGADKSLFRVGGSDDWEYADLLIAFLVESYNENPNVYKTFVRLYDGAVQASLLNFTPKEIELVTNSEFLVRNAVLDTNFVLRLLGLQSPLDNEVARSTLQSLLEVGVKFYVLPQTIEETCSSIDGFLREIEPVAQQVAAFLPQTNIATSGFWSAMQSGTARTDFLEWTNPENVSRELSEHYSVVIVDEWSEATVAADEVVDLIQHKNVDKYAERQAKHDLTLIAYCQGKRPKRPQSLGTTDWWVLTNDVKLASWDRRHRKSQTCMTGVQVSNLLWLFTKKDAGEGLTNTIVSLAGRDAVSSTEISNFAAHIDKYGTKFGDNPRSLDDLSNVLAHAVLSTSDVKMGSMGDSEFQEVIEKKAKQIRLQTELEHKSHKEMTDSQARQIDALKRDVEREKLLSKKRQIENDIESSDASLTKTQDDIMQLKELQIFCAEQERPVARWLLLLFAVTAIVAVGITAFFAAMLANGPLKALLVQFMEIAELIATLTGMGIVLAVPTAVYYLAVTLRFNSPYSPAMLFDELKRVRILKRRHGYIIEHRFSPDFAQGELGAHLVNLENRKKEEESSLTLLKGSLAEVEDELCRLHD